MKNKSVDLARLYHIRDAIIEIEEYISDTNNNAFAKSNSGMSLPQRDPVHIIRSVWTNRTIGTRSGATKPQDTSVQSIKNMHL